MSNIREKERQGRLLTDDEMADYLATSKSYTREFCDEIGVVRYFGRSGRNDKRIVDAWLNNPDSPKKWQSANLEDRRRKNDRTQGKTDTNSQRVGNSTLEGCKVVPMHETL